MKRVIILSIILISFWSCSINRKDKTDCKYKVENSIKDLAKHITINKETKVYTLNYNKLPDFERSKYKKMIDSLENLTYIPPNDNTIKHAIFCQKLRSLINLGCEISIIDIRKYFGVETRVATKNYEIVWLSYFFNNTSYPECYSRYAEFGAYSKCSTLQFEVNENQILTKVITDHF